MGDVDELNNHIGLLLCEDCRRRCASCWSTSSTSCSTWAASWPCPASRAAQDEALAQLDGRWRNTTAAAPRLENSFCRRAPAPCQAHLPHRGAPRRARRGGARPAGSCMPPRCQYLNRLSDLLFVLSRVLNTWARRQRGRRVYWKSERLARASGRGADRPALGGAFSQAKHRLRGLLRCRRGRRNTPGTGWPGGAAHAGIRTPRHRGRSVGRAHHPQQGTGFLTAAALAGMWPSPSGSEVAPQHLGRHAHLLRWPQVEIPPSSGLAALAGFRKSTGAPCPPRPADARIHRRWRAGRHRHHAIGVAHQTMGRPWRRWRQKLGRPPARGGSPDPRQRLHSGRHIVERANSALYAAAQRSTAAFGITRIWVVTRPRRPCNSADR